MKTHNFGDGPVYDESLKRWRVEFSYKNQLGDRKQLKKRFRHRSHAEKWFHETERLVVLGAYDQLQRFKTLTLGAAFDLYRGSVRDKKSFETTFQQNLRLWERELSRETLLSDVTKDQIIAARARRIEGGVAKSTSNTNLAVLKAAFKWLETENHWPKNPVSGIPFYRVDNRRTFSLSVEQFGRLIFSCENGPWYMKPAVVIGTLTGLRKSNNLGLEWTEVDFKNACVRIPGTKTKNGRTLIIPMCDIVYGILLDLFQSRHKRNSTQFVFLDCSKIAWDGRRRFDQQFKMAAVRRVLTGERMSAVAKDLGIGTELVWRWEKRAREKGEAHLYEIGRPRIVRAQAGYETFMLSTDLAWSIALRDSGIERDFKEAHNDSFHFHDLRHTFASWHVKLGTNPFRLKHLMGHNNLASTERYAHVALSENRAEKAAIELLLSHSELTSPEERAERGRNTLVKLFPKILPNRTISPSKHIEVSPSHSKQILQPSLFAAVD